MNKCEKCGFLHYRTDPCRKPKDTNGDKAEPSADAKPNLKRQLAPVKSAGPVRHTSAADLQPAKADSSGTDGFEVSPQRRAGFDKKAWMRDYMREHRRGIRRRVK